MASPVPKHLRTDTEHADIAMGLREHAVDLMIDKSKGEGT